MTSVQPALFGSPQTQATSDDYYTPRWVFEAMGLTFDIDVCAPPGGVEWVPALRYFDVEADGLAQAWTGRVWMNPPFSHTAVWWRKFADHRCGVALMPLVKSLVLNSVMEQAEGVCVGPEGGEIRFVRPGDPKPVRVWTPVFFAAFGDECVDAISRLGVVRVRPFVAPADAAAVERRSAAGTPVPAAPDLNTQEQ